MGGSVASCGSPPTCANCACEGRKPDEVCIWPSGVGESYPHAATMAISEALPAPHTLSPVAPHTLNLVSESTDYQAEPDEAGGYEFEGSAAQPEVTQAQVVVKNFVRGLVKGRRVELLATKGGTAECTLFLDRKLTTLSLQRGKGDSKKRAVPLEDISEIAVGAESGEEFGLATTDMCVVLILDGGQAIGIAFPDEEERDTFALCLTMFVDGRRNEIKRKQEKAAGLRAA